MTGAVYNFFSLHSSAQPQVTFALDPRSLLHQTEYLNRREAVKRYFSAF